MKIFNYLIPILFILIIIVCKIKKVAVYDNFIVGIKKTLPLIYSLFPYLVGMFILSELFTKSGLSALIVKFISPIFSLLSIPVEIAPLAIIKPFSGSGSLAMLSDLYVKFGVDSYVSKCASCVYAGSEAIFYVSSVYFCACKTKKLYLPIIITIIAFFCSVIFACFICNFL